MPRAPLAPPNTRPSGATLDISGMLGASVAGSLVGALIGAVIAMVLRRK